mgnify:CR=1 FL=1
MIDAKPVDDALTFLVEHLPPQMQLVITTREDPALPLPRLRARRQLTELRAADPAEVRARIGLVPQEPVIFAASALENIRYGRPDADDAAVRAAASRSLSQFSRNCDTDGT